VPSEPERISQPYRSDYNEPRSDPKTAYLMPIDRVTLSEYRVITQPRPVAEVIDPQTAAVSTSAMRSKAEICLRGSLMAACGTS